MKEAEAVRWQSAGESRQRVKSVELRMQEGEAERDVHHVGRVHTHL